MRLELERLIAESVAYVERMTPDERAEMTRRQKESWARAEMSWPKPRFRWENGVKIYESYADYLND